MRHTVERGTAMADVTLRAYVKEIDNLIERDQLDEAIAHCRHILQIYPKHLNTYRLLGKAYLEAKRFGDAADIFQRVLSAVPEDFVSHIGMAIVREDEGNLDAAIWHMERAFEANPANPAIRQELSRLIGRRDGLEPHKIRLTRGALARQYAQGELFPQAIAELRSALQEDPDRPDLELLLAKMYWQSEQYDAAKTLCKQIIEKLPYSFDANRIMAAIYQVTNNPEKAGEYHRRLAGLDPYMAFVDSAVSDPKEISASAVKIDHSDWLPGQPLPTVESAEPDWVSSLGVDLSEEEELPEVDSVPSWMGELEGEVSSRPTGPSALSAQEPEEALSEEGDIPEWMKEAGWEPSTGEIPEGPVSFSDEELEALDSGGPMPIPEEERGDEEEIAPAEIPDWLQDIAPSDIPAEPEPEMEQQDQQGEKKEFVPDWLADISSEADEVPPEPVEDTQEIVTPESPKSQPTPAVVELGDEDQPEVPTWVEDQAPGATSTIISWLGDRPGTPPDEDQEPQKAPEEPVQMSQQAGSASDEEEIPSWLDGLDIEELEEPIAPEPSGELEGEDEAPSWLAGVADAASDVDLDMREAPAVQDEIELEASEDVETPQDEEAWLRELAEAEIEEEAATAEEPDRVAEAEVEPAEPETAPEVPGWLQGIAETDEAASSIPEKDEPDWLRGLDLDEETAEAPSAAPRQEVPDWLQGIAEPSDEEESATPVGADVSESAMDQYSDRDSQVQEEVEDEFDLQSLREFEAEISAEPDLEEPVISRAPEELGVGEDLDDEEVYQWLESLAQEETEEPGEAPAAAVETRPAEPTPIVDESVPPEEPEASLDWLEDLASERGLDVDVTPQADASQLSTPQEAMPTSEPSIEEEEEEAPDWLREMASSPTDETVISPRPPEFKAEFEEPELEEPEVPDWLEEATSIAADVPAEPGEAEAQIAMEQEPAAPSEEAIETVRREQVRPVIEPLQEEIAPSAQPPEAVEPEPVHMEREQRAPAPVDEAPVTPPSVIEPTPPVPEPGQEQIGEVPSEVPVEKEEPPAKRPEKFKEPLTEPTQLLQSARQALSAGDAGRALSDYRKLIDRKQDIDTVIQDLQRAAERYPNLPKVWQALGDAYMEADQLPDAIKAYKRGMEVA
jgi:tetratricopeptide (TPR) repeat protein